MTFLEAATQRPIVIKSLKVAAIVGTILVLINYSNKFFPLDLAPSDWIRMAMTYCVPYCVSTYSAATTLLDRETKSRISVQ